MPDNILVPPVGNAVTPYTLATQDVGGVHTLRILLPSGAATEVTLAALLTELQLKADLGETQPVSVAATIPTVVSGSVAGLGNNTILTPAAGKRLRVFYLSYNPLLAVEAAFRFGAAGSLFLRNNVLANSVIAKEFGFGKYVQGAIDESLILNLSLGVNVIWNAHYVEV